MASVLDRHRVAESSRWIRPAGGLSWGAMIARLVLLLVATASVAAGQYYSKEEIERTDRLLKRFATEEPLRVTFVERATSLERPGEEGEEKRYAGRVEIERLRTTAVAQFRIVLRTSAKRYDLTFLVPPDLRVLGTRLVLRGEKDFTTLFSSPVRLPFKMTGDPLELRLAPNGGPDPFPGRPVGGVVYQSIRLELSDRGPGLVRSPDFRIRLAYETAEERFNVVIRCDQPED